LIEIQQNRIQSLKEEMEKEAHVKFESEKFNSNSSLITIIMPHGTGAARDQE